MSRGVAWAWDRHRRKQEERREKATERKAWIASLPHETKSVALELKSVSPRRLTGYATVFNDPDGSPHIDLHGDIIVPGAYRETLAWWKNAGEWPALLDHHQGNKTSAVIGEGVNMREDPHGLLCDFELIHGEEGEKIAARIRQGLVTGLSIGYKTIRAKAPNAAQRALGARRVLESLWLDEVSLVRSPSNRLARVAGLKMREAEERFLDEAIEIASSQYWNATTAGLEPHERDEMALGIIQRLASRGRG
jgi:HK97 family phage prohead protease